MQGSCWEYDLVRLIFNRIGSKTEVDAKSSIYTNQGIYADLSEKHNVK